MNHPAGQAATHGMGYAASGTAIGGAGLAWADQWPIILQFANLGLVAVSIAVGLFTLVEKVRHWQKDTRDECEHEEQERETRRIQRATLRALGVPVDTDPAPLSPGAIHAESLTRFEETWPADQAHHEGKQ